MQALCVGHIRTHGMRSRLHKTSLGIALFGFIFRLKIPAMPFRVHPILPTIVLPYRASVSRPFYRLHRRQRRQYHNRRRRNRRRNLAARIATRAGISVDATSQVLAALGLEVFHELAMYGDAVIPNLVTFNLEAGHNREFLRATTIGTFESNFRAFLA